MRLVFILLILVVLPTAILSLFAGHSIQSRELVLRKRLEQNASARLNAANTRLVALLQADLDKIQSEFQNTVLSGTDVNSMQQKVAGLCTRCKLAKDFYLFMNPWNFIFPPVSTTLTSDKDSEKRLNFLKQELIQNIALASNADDTLISFKNQNGIYCFVPVKNFSSVYAGMSVDMDKAMGHIKQILVDVSSDQIQLRIINYGENDFVARNANISVYTSFESSHPKRLPPFDDTEDRGVVLTRDHLPAPFSDIKLAAYLMDKDSVLAAEKLETSLIKWGIVLLSIVIVSSSIILIYKALNQAKEVRQRSELVISMSHDLRTPVAAMRVLADSLCAGRVTDPQKQREFVCSISKECERMGDMVERILFFFRQDQRAMTYHLSEVALDKIVEQIVDSAKNRFPNSVNIRLRIEDGVPLVKGDFEGLSKVFTNLIDNAVKYGKSEQAITTKNKLSTGMDVDIDVRVQNICKKGRDWVVVSVKDQGIGIARKEQKKIFKRFYRVETVEHSHIGGIGLGLSLCYEIVRAHHGRLVVESELGKGATFSVWLKAVKGRI